MSRIKIIIGQILGIVKIIFSTHAGNAFSLALMVIIYYLWMENYPFIFTEDSSGWIWLESFLLAICVFTGQRWIAAFITWSLITAFLLYSNHEKTELLEFPISEQDIIIFTANPVGFFDAIGIPRFRQYGFMALLGIAVLYWLFRLVCRVKTNVKNINYLVCVVSFISYITIAYSAIAIFMKFYAAYGNFIFLNQGEYLDDVNIWSKKGVMHISKKLTPLGFLSYSHNTHRHKILFEQLKLEKKDMPPEVLSEMVSKYSISLPKNTKKLPNIVFVLAESTFDPNVIFSLNEKVVNTLFQSTPNSLSALLHVSPIGGGTWKTEFETLTGIDSRLFGFLGEYTHISLAPYLKKSFPSYLKSYGYESAAFYATSGNFYGARRAYKYYGLPNFYDAKDLDLESNWTKFSDEDMADRITQEFKENSANPFFYYVLTLQNHSPHPCKNFDIEKPLPITFALDNNLDRNCQLNEYITRAESTERAFNKIVDRLRIIEEKSGRPFIIVIFGDHQPKSFVGNDFEVSRKAISKFFTFYKIQTSPGFILPPLEKTFHATLIPTLISTIFSKNVSHIYLPENIYIYDKCADTDNLKDCLDLGVLPDAYKNYIGYVTP